MEVLATLAKVVQYNSHEFTLLLQGPMMKYIVFNVKTLNLDAVQMTRLQLEVLILKVNNRN